MLGGDHQSWRAMSASARSRADAWRSDTGAVGTRGVRGGWRAVLLTASRDGVTPSGPGSDVVAGRSAEHADARPAGWRASRAAHHECNHLRSSATGSARTAPPGSSRAQGLALSTPPATVAHVTQQHKIDDGPPPLPSPEATDAERGDHGSAGRPCRRPEPGGLSPCLRRVRRTLARRRRDPSAPPRRRRSRRVISGKVLDASALAALARRRPAALAWFDTARLVGITLYLPTPALAEVRAVRPDAAPLLADLLSHPSVVLGELDSATAACTA